MSVAQTLPNIAPNTPLFQALNQQSGNPMYSFEVVQLRLTSAQLLALKTTPIQLIPAPGGNGLQSYWFDSVTIKYNFGTTPYTLNAGTLKVFYGPVANAHPITADAAAILTQGQNRITTNTPTLVVSDVTANILNQPIFMGNDGGANYTLGDGTIDITVMFGRVTP